MFQWLKDWFNPKSSCLDNLPPFSGSYPPMPECKPPKKNISEPVFAIERSMIEHPSRWKVVPKRDSLCLSTEITISYTVMDIKNNLKFYGHITDFYHYGGVYCKSQFVVLSWATQEEKDHLVNAVMTMQNKKLARIERIKQMKKNKERERLMEIYK